MLSRPGAVVIAALSLMLLAFGAGMGFSAVSPWSNSGVSATTLSVAAGIYLLVAACLSSTIGGYLAGRLRRRWAGLHTHEVYFRDTAHGFLAWAFATVIGAAFLASASANIAGGATAGIAQAAGQQPARQRGGSPLDYYADALLRPSGAPASHGRQSSGGRQDPDAMVCGKAMFRQAIEAISLSLWLRVQG